MITTHKKTFQTLLFILLFLVALITTIFLTQYNSQKNIASLIQSNQSAALTFDINNRLQEIVNYSELIEKNSRNLYLTGKDEYAQETGETIKLIENHLSALTKSSKKNNSLSDLDELIKLVQNKIAQVNNILVACKSNDKASVSRMADSLVRGKPDERIYNTALEVQKKIENNLKVTLTQNSRLSQKVLRSDKILSLVAILAVVILGTIIIKRLLDQLKLISKLALEKERADKSAGIKEQFLANMSHEIRTPINAVIGFSNLLQKSSLQNDQKQFVDLIQKSGENLLAVVNDILDISKLEAGMMRITKKPFNIRDSFLSLEMMFYHKATEKNISFSCIIDDEIPDILVGDAERLVQVMINLINNAIKFTTEGEVIVNVRLQAKTASTVDLQFSIKDTGIGIPKNKLHTIFERFEQVDSDTSRQYGGTGLGLSIVKRIINLQGGEISVQSEPGEGSDFIFDINYEYIESPLMVVDTHSTIQNSENVAFQNIRALVAEDNITNQTLLKYTLKQWNLEYDLAENGQQALEMVKNNNYDIILMDIQMPIMDGYESVKRIRKDINCSIPIIAMTAHVLPTEREKCMNAGMNDYLSKPLKEAELLKLLKKYLPSRVLNAGAPLSKFDRKLDFRYIDLKYLHTIFAHNVAYINEIMYQFREQYPIELKELTNQMESASLEGVENWAHHLKTTVSTLSIDTPLRVHLDKIEDFAKEGNWSRIHEEVNALLKKEAAVMREVNTAMASG